MNGIVSDPVIVNAHCVAEVPVGIRQSPDIGRFAPNRKGIRARLERFQNLLQDIRYMPRCSVRHL